MFGPGIFAGTGFAAGIAEAPVPEEGWGDVEVLYHSEINVALGESLEFGGGLDVSPDLETVSPSIGVPAKVNLPGLSFKVGEGAGAMAAGGPAATVTYTTEPVSEWYRSLTGPRPSEGNE